MTINKMYERLKKLKKSRCPQSDNERIHRLIRDIIDKKLRKCLDLTDNEVLWVNAHILNRAYGDYKFKAFNVGPKDFDDWFQTINFMSIWNEWKNKI